VFRFKDENVRGVRELTEEARMNKAEVLKVEILRQYKSVRQFALEMKIPYSTLVTALDRGIGGMAYGTVIMICDKLNLNPVDFTSLEEGQDLGERIVENRVMRDYLKLNKVGRKKLLDYMGDLALLGKYIT
jgi:transcriptional regulator